MQCYKLGINSCGLVVNVKWALVGFSGPGYDGAINVEFLSKGFIKQQDLSIADMWLGRTWDWVLSLEVGEHIPALYEDVFIDNLVRHGCKGKPYGCKGKTCGLVEPGTGY